MSTTTKPSFFKLQELPNDILVKLYQQLNLTDCLTFKNISKHLHGIFIKYTDQILTKVIKNTAGNLFGDAFPFSLEEENKVDKLYIRRIRHAHQIIQMADPINKVASLLNTRYGEPMCVGMDFEEFTEDDMTKEPAKLVVEVMVYNAQITRFFPRIPLAKIKSYPPYSKIALPASPFELAKKKKANVGVGMNQWNKAVKRLDKQLIESNYGMFPTEHSHGPDPPFSWTRKEVIRGTVVNRHMQPKDLLRYGFGRLQGPRYTEMEFIDDYCKATGVVDKIDKEWGKFYKDGKLMI